MRVAATLALLASFALAPRPAAAQIAHDWRHEEPSGTLTPPILVLASSMARSPGGVFYVAYGEWQGSWGIGLRRIDPDGSLVWTRFVPVDAVESPMVAISPLDGGIYVAASGSFGARVARFDSNGVLAWSVPLTGPVTGFDSIRLGRGLVFDASGAVYTCGRMHTGTHFAFDFDGFVASHDTAGNLRFVSFVTGSLGRADDVYAIRSDASTGGLRVTGTLDGDDANGGRSTFLAGMSSSGVLSPLAVDPAGGPSFVRLLDFELDSAGRAYLVRGLGATSLAWTSSTVSRYDSAGAVLNSISYSSSQRRPWDVALAANGRVAVVGTTTGVQAPGFVTQFDPSWVVDWDTLEYDAGAQSHLLRHVHADPNGDVTVVGSATMPPGAGGVSDSRLYLVRYSAAGARRFVYEDSIDGLESVGPLPPLVDDFGRVWVSYVENAVFGSISTSTTLRCSPQSHSYCHGDGSVLACPCGNSSAPLAQSGCTNSTGSAAQLSDSGVAGVANDSLVMTCTGVEATAIGLLVEATAAQSGVPFGDGLRCVAGSFLRLYVQPAVGGVHTFPSAGNPSIHARSLALGGTVVAGSRRAYQVYYRDANALFCPSPAGASFNFSNALMIAWGP